MRFDYKLTDKTGYLYSGGNITFSNNGEHLYSSSGVHIMSYNLRNDNKNVLPYEHRDKVDHISVSHDSKILLSFDINGHGIFFNISRGQVFSKITLKSKIRIVSFSPDGRFLAIATENDLSLWDAPDPDIITVSPLNLIRRLSSIITNANSISWSKDCSFLAISSKDMMTSVFGTLTEQYISLSSSKGSCLGVWFAEDDTKIYSISKYGVLSIWDFSSANFTVSHNPEKKPLIGKEDISAISSSYNPTSNQLTVLYTSGLLQIIETERFENIYSATMEAPSALSTTEDGDWIALGSLNTGRLAVFEWKTENFILKQFGHTAKITEIASSENSQLIATGDEVGSIFLWSKDNGYYIASNNDTISNIISLEFSSTTKALMCAYENGKISIFDSIRLKEFRTFYTPDNETITAASIDKSGEFLAVALRKTYRIILWSIRTSSILEMFEYHSAPVVHLGFEPSRGDKLLSASMDKTARVLDIFSRDDTTIELTHNSEVTAACFSPKGDEIATASRKGEISIWKNNHLILSINVKNDVSEEIFYDEKIASEQVTSISYTPDGLNIAVTAKSPFVCFYSLEDGFLMRKIRVAETQNIYERMRQKEGRDRVSRKMDFFQDGQSWIVTSPEGALLYSLSKNELSKKFIDPETDPDRIEKYIGEKCFLVALLSSMALGATPLILKTVMKTPEDVIASVLVDLPPEDYILPLLTNLSLFLDSSKEKEHCLKWISICIRLHHKYIRKHSIVLLPVLRNIEKELSFFYREIDKELKSNIAIIEYVTACLDEIKLE
eukprot:GHVP01003843.1.p1 GENE.GHVP01003843.1~~GHVP01003843.1.p1  ORF type:complete len:783 (+),score=139.12 GHVP01003843.1:746-3094(+)